MGIYTSAIGKIRGLSGNVSSYAGRAINSLDLHAMQRDLNTARTRMRTRADVLMAKSYAAKGFRQNTGLTGAWAMGSLARMSNKRLAMTGGGVLLGAGGIHAVRRRQRGY